MSMLTEFRAQIQSQMTPRLAYGFALMAAIGLAFLVVRLHEYRVQSAKELVMLRDELTIVTQPDGASIWEPRVQDASEAQKAWDRRQWKGATPGIASADAQANLNQIIAQSGLESVKLSVSSDPVKIGESDLLRYEIAGIGDSHALLTLLVNLATSEKAFVITDVSAPLREKQRTRLVIGGYLPYTNVVTPTEQAP